LDELPSKGQRLREFELRPVVGNGVIHLSDYRGRANLVLIVSDQRSETLKLLSDIAARYSEIKREEAEVLVIVRLSRPQAAEVKNRLKLPCPVLADDDGRVHRQLGALDSQGDDSAAVYVTDRFGEVFGAYRKSGGQPLPGIADILNWLEFINAQCPECEPPEWPI
jgi:peroxiredoxin